MKCYKMKNTRYNYKY
uniref:Uncharacterized protein n=1 Tax=Anopheles quadriannulatus TaxID=34691 RepID=A0A182XSM7_ANOQN